MGEWSEPITSKLVGISHGTLTIHYNIVCFIVVKPDVFPPPSLPPLPQNEELEMRNEDLQRRIDELCSSLTKPPQETAGLSKVRTSSSSYHPPTSIGHAHDSSLRRLEEERQVEIIASGLFVFFLSPLLPLHHLPLFCLCHCQSWIPSLSPLKGSLLLPPWLSVLSSDLIITGFRPKCCCVCPVPSS